jgi:RNA polymerase sigma-70 factor, ECF subfamily
MAATTGVTSTIDLDPDRLEQYRRELTGYCYRMLGSPFEAEDAVQDTMLRAWQAADRFEGRASVRSWLYRIATNVCLDMLRGRSRRARPMELGPSMPPEVSSLSRVLPEHSWVSPIADERVLPPDADPADIAEARESIRLAFVTALQHLPARQRAVLILCEVLRWSAAETAELLGTSVAAVNSALQRARATLAGLPDSGRAGRAQVQDTAGLLDRYVDAFERYDISTLVTLLHEDAIQSMPPFAMWLRGRDDIVAWMLGPGRECAGSRLIPVSLSGCPAVAQYRADPAGGHMAFAVHVLDITDGRIREISTFLEMAHAFSAWGLPSHLPVPEMAD